MYGIAVSALDSQLDDPSSQPVNVLVKIPSLKKESQGTSAPFEFGTRGHCIKGKQCHHVTVTNKKLICVQSNLDYFTFMQCPLVTY